MAIEDASPAANARIEAMIMGNGVPDTEEPERVGPIVVDTEATEFGADYLFTDGCILHLRVETMADGDVSDWIADFAPHGLACPHGIGHKDEDFINEPVGFKRSE